MRLVSELRRRNVFRMAVLYLVAAWLVMQVAEVIIDLANLPDRIGPIILGLLVVGFPIALLFSWFYELTAEGVSLEHDIDPTESTNFVADRRLDFIVIALLCAAVILFAYDKWRLPGPPEKSIAVLPFENLSADPAQEYFSDGISEDLLNLLAQIPELRVISRSSAFSFKGKDIAIPALAGQLNVAHVVEGSVRKIGDRVRITAQLIEARSDSHLWSESYDRKLDDIFAVQDEIAAAISEACTGRGPDGAAHWCQGSQIRCL
jgi:TolB-like protein